MIDCDVNLVRELRRRTNVGVLECKKALIQSNGNIELAIENMRKTGLQKISNKFVSTKNFLGVILAKTEFNKKFGVLIELNCETDFVTKTDVFKKFSDYAIKVALKEKINSVDLLNFKLDPQRINLISIVKENINVRRLSVLEGKMIDFYVHNSKIGVLISSSGASAKLIKNIAMHIIASNPAYIDINSIPKDIIEKERRIQMDIALQYNKSHLIAEKIVLGRMKKFFSEITLMEQKFIMDDIKTVKQVLDENCCCIYKFVRFALGDNIE